MDSQSSGRGPRRGRIAVLAAGGVLAGGAVLGAVGVAAANASPVLTAATPAPSASASAGASHGHRWGGTAVTGAKAATLKAAAVKAVPGATVQRVETDGTGYEVHLTKTDGSRVTVEFDSALTQTAIETGRGHGGGHGGRHGDEVAVTGAKADTLKAAALKAVPGATVERVETDSDGAAYEVHLKKADGSRVTVEFDSALKQTAIETGRGHGGGHGDRTKDTDSTS